MKLHRTYGSSGLELMGKTRVQKALRSCINKMVSEIKEQYLQKYSVWSATVGDFGFVLLDVLVNIAHSCVRNICNLRVLLEVLLNMVNCRLQKTKEKY
mgnify:CR=1 FL=1